MELFFHDALVVGSGAAGYNAVCRLKEAGIDAALIAESVCSGASRNAGSDKQTYYKLGLAGKDPDSAAAMAADLFACGSVDGDNALCEAALSARCFFSLCEAGVPFPTDRYGEYVGYRTDHDRRSRATSAGPLTSRMMTEALQRRAEDLGVRTYDGFLAVKVLTEEKTVRGLLALEKATGKFAAFGCQDLILCVGGPAGIYADSVYPESQTGAASLFLEAGAALQNVTEWQYGLASLSPRWNVSGTYMQALPAFVSVDPDGAEREFLSEAFPDPAEALSRVFLKGYEWPFDQAKARTGSSLIDLLVYRERILRGRRVYLDYRKNPFGFREIPFAGLCPEARDYLEKAGAAFGTPLERLEKMNGPAVELYRSKGVDLASERLEIALCAQHQNGGAAVDLWWQTSVKGLFAAGECAGTHGAVRPGGSALNAGQVGSLRAAEFIAAKKRKERNAEAFRLLAEKKIRLLREETERIPEGIRARLENARRRMTAAAGPIRDRGAMERCLREVRKDLLDLARGEKTPGPEELTAYFKLKDALITQEATLSAMLDHAASYGSRGSAIYTDPHGEKPVELDEEIFRFRSGAGDAGDTVQEVRLEEGEVLCRRRPVRPLPCPDEAFETVWAAFRRGDSKR